MNRRSTPAWIALIAVVAVLSLAALGCEEEAGPLPANVPPTTFLDIQGPDLDTLNYRQILNWWGADPDGEVIGYCVHWDGEWTPPDDAVRCDFDPEFWFTTATTDTFIVPTNGEFAERTFTVRAVDDDGIIDPVGKSQLFRLGNWRPSLAWATSLVRPTVSLPAVSFSWSPVDLDGRETVGEYRVWLDGQDSTAALVTADTLFALAPEDFDGIYGERTIFVQAVDEAHTLSNVIRHTWTVEAPPDADFLLIDNTFSAAPGASREKGFYRAIMDSVAAGNYFVYDVEARGDFRSDREVGPLFSLFDGVVWFAGWQRTEQDVSMFRNLAFAEDAIRDYLEDDGRVALFYRNTMGDSTGLSPAFTREVLGVTEFFRQPSGTHEFVIRPGGDTGAKIASPYLAAGDSLLLGSSSADSEFFLLADNVVASFVAPPGYIFQRTSIEPTPDQSAIPAYMGVVSRRLGGPIAVTDFFISRGPTTSDAHARAAVGLLRDVLER